MRDSLGPWLHQVAYRTASCADRPRSDAGDTRGMRRGWRCEQRKKRGRIRLRMGASASRGDRTPARAAFVSRSCSATSRVSRTSRRLGTSDVRSGRCKSRLSRGRERLRNRLRRRGLAPNAGLLATALKPGGPDEVIAQELVHPRPAPPFSSFRPRSSRTGPSPLSPGRFSKSCR